MSDIATELKDENEQTGAERRAARVWRACLECRKKKSKCDGKDICNPCRIRDRECVYPDTNDNASSSRQILSTLDERFQKMDALCERMESMMEKFLHVAGSLESLPHSRIASEVEHSTLINPILSVGTQILELHEDGQMVDLDEEIDDVEEDDDADESSAAGEVQDHVMTTDSYGKLRYVGGTGTMVMIEALKSLSPAAGEGHSPLSPAESRRSEKGNISSLELPFFVRGVTWPELPYLPKAEQLVRPPRYISDLLINLYFDQLHFTMPVLYKQHFMQRYNILTNERSASNVDSGFLSVFFAVCACASGLLPREPGSSPMHTGLQYYQSAILMHFKSTGEGSIEQVQCLALLSMCSAGWNTLAQSWKFAGQAIRAAQDLGLHRSPERGTGETLKEELCRRVWWSVYGLDRLLSVCLGRPMGVDDSDCNCEMPLDMDDAELEAYCNESPNLRSKPSSPSRLAGFISFSKLCYISGRIVRVMNPLQMCQMRKKDSPKRLREKQKLVESLDAELSEWLRTVPDSIKFSANSMDMDSPHLTMCVILYIVHAGCVINLHRPLIPEINASSPSVSSSTMENSSLLQCVSAARSCISIAELIQSRVPPSHHLAFCTQYLAFSGVFLLRSSPISSQDFTADVEASIHYLANLENVWAGARRSRLIIEELLKQTRMERRTWNFDDFGTDEIADYMFGQENADFQFSSFDMG